MKLFVANRGESAARVLSTAGPLGWCTVVPWVEGEAAHWWASLADEVVNLPQGAFSDPEALAHAAQQSGCDAIHPGWGLLSESPEFAAATLACGLLWLGPGPEALSLLSDKAQATSLAASVGLPTAPGGPINAQDPAPSGPYPILVKARRAGGGLGQVVAQSPDDWPQAAQEALAQTQSSFGLQAAQAGLLWAPLMPCVRHVEVQVAADAHGTVRSLGLRDCSVQRRRQKLVEESPAPGLPSEQGAAMEAWACALMKAAAYQGLGTVEFLLDPNQSPYFLEVNARLQVEHPLTEWRWGLDLVAMQMALAQGHRLDALLAENAPRGWAMEVRLLCEDPFDGVPRPGLLQRVLWPGGPFVRVDPGLGAPDVVDPRYDSMVAKLSAWGQHREEARLRLLGALQRLEAVGSLRHNQARLIQILKDPDFVAARHHTAWSPAPLSSPEWEGEAPWMQAMRPMREPNMGWPKQAWQSLGRGDRP